MVAQYPRSVSPRYRLASHLYRRKDYRGAAAEYQAAIPLDRSRAESYQQLGIALYRLRDYDRAAEAFRTPSPATGRTRTLSTRWA